MQQADVLEIERKADLMRQYICKMCLLSNSGHPASSLSAVDVIAALYFKSMQSDDCFILSKGHAAPALYSAFILKNIFPLSTLQKFREFDSPFQGHPDVQKLPQVNATTGALGQGLSIAIGRALAMRLKGQTRRSYCLIGDGESQEGQIWEAALFAANRRIDNLIVFTDYNRRQADGPLEEVMPLGDLQKKWESFGWFVQKVNGHSITEITHAVSRAKEILGQPTMILASTEKGYVSADLTVLGGEHAAAMTSDVYTKVIEKLGLADFNIGDIC